MVCDGGWGEEVLRGCSWLVMVGGVRRFLEGGLGLGWWPR